MKTQRRKLGVYGGSFDPIHRGHLVPVQQAAERLGLDRVLYVPTARPPHKGEQTLTAALKRYVMVELALLDLAWCEVSPAELDESRPSYSVDTLELLRAQYPQDDLFFLLGSDSFYALPTWKSWRRILELAELAVLARPGSLPTERSQIASALEPWLDHPRVHWIADEPVELSATKLRRTLVDGGLPEAGEVPERVLQYIKKYTVYR